MVAIFLSHYLSKEYKRGILFVSVFPRIIGCIIRMRGTYPSPKNPWTSWDFHGSLSMGRVGYAMGKGSFPEVSLMASEFPLDRREYHGAASIIRVCLPWYCVVGSRLSWKSHQKPTSHGRKFPMVHSFPWDPTTKRFPTREDTMLKFFPWQMLIHVRWSLQSIFRSCS